MLAVALLLPFLIQVAVCDDDQTMALKFLDQYGYISHTRSGNHDVPTAIRRFQKYFGLPVSGKLDASTVRLMKKPRCGMPDTTGESRRRRFSTISKWNKYHLTYYVKPGEDLPADLQREIFSNALKYWADVSGLSFSEVSSVKNADIKISFGRYGHNGTTVEPTCPYPFSGAGGVLAHAYFPRDGRAHFDEDEYYTHQTYNGVNLLWVGTHEFGHSLGLDHSSVRGAIMYPYYTGYVPNMKLHSDDIAGIQSLYGSNNGGGDGAGVQPPAPTETPTKPPTKPPTEPTEPVCNDKFQEGGNNCKPYVNIGYCNKYMRNMKYWCEKSCGFC